MLLDEIYDSFKKDDKAPQVKQIGQVFNWKEYVASSEVAAMSSWTDNHIYRFSWNPYHKEVQMHYKKFDQSQGYFGLHASTYVTSFKEVEKEAKKDAAAWDRHAGVLLGRKDRPTGEPSVASNIDFNEKQETKAGKVG